MKTYFLGFPFASAKLSVTAILSSLWSLTSQPATDTHHLHQWVWTALSNLKIKMSLEKSEVVKLEFKTKPDRLLVNQPSQARDHGLETWLGAGTLQLEVSQGK